MHPDPAKDDVIEADTPEVFLERMQLMRDFYWDPHRDPKDRVLSKAEHKEIKRRWDAFLPDEDPVSFQDIKHSRLEALIRRGQCIECPGWRQSGLSGWKVIFGRCSTFCIS